MTADRIEAIRGDIPYLAGRIYVDNASVSPVPTRVRVASEHYNALVSLHLRDLKELSRPHFDKGRHLAAKLIGGTASGIAFVQNTAHGLSLVALGVDWRDGDNLVVLAEEFPSNFLCWAQLAEKGVEIRMVSSQDGRVDPEQIEKAVDGRTRVVAVSHVQFYSGFRVDLDAISEICSRRGPLLVVDGTQSVGAIGINIRSSGVDVLVASAHKWLMGPRGVGFASFSERALGEIRPRIVGWLSVNDPFAFHRKLDFLPDARRFEPGTPNGCGILGLAERLAQIDELGISWIEARVLDLSERLIDKARRQGLTVCFEFERQSRSGIVLLSRADVPSVDLLSRLNSEGIYASIRNGAIRVSPHYYNTVDEMDQVGSVLSKARAA